MKVRYWLWCLAYRISDLEVSPHYISTFLLCIEQFDFHLTVRKDATEREVHSAVARNLVQKINNHPYTLLVDHLPEVTDRTINRALGCDNEIKLKILSVDAANTACVDIPTTRLITLITHEDGCLHIWVNVWVDVHRLELCDHGLHKLARKLIEFVHNR